MRNPAVLGLVLLLAVPAFPRQVPAVCGTSAGNWREEQFLHRQAVRARALRRARLGLKDATPAAAGRDAGNIAILEDGDGLVARRNEFDLDRRTLTFLPAAGATRYTYQTGDPGYDAAAAQAGAPLAGMTDDDSRAVSLPFSFPFYGAAYDRVYVNSDGNLTFTAGDNASTDRSLGRLTAGPPRIAPLFDDLDPSRSPAGIRVLSEPGRFVVSWPQVPEFNDFGTGAPQTFQVRLYPDGRIELAWNGITTGGAVVGIAPGRLNGTASLVSFATEGSGEYSGAVAERFTGNLAEVDITSTAQRFFQSHEDAYDYVVVFNNEEIGAGTSAVAYEVTVRNPGTGYGDHPVDVGREYGSAARLRAVINMGPLSQYPRNPLFPVPLRQVSGDTPVTVLAHEAGHLFLAFASVRDPADPFARPMLGYQNAHWFFGFNSEASLLEGNRIRDNGENAVPRFITTGTVESFSPLDQYLMGLRPAAEVEPDHQMFYVDGLGSAYLRRVPQKGVSLNGPRREVHMDELLAVLGRRTPDHTVAQRRFRFAFVLVVRQGSQPSADDLAKLEGFRAAFEEYFQQAAGDRAAAETYLKLNLRLSVFPAAGVLAGDSAPATLAVDTAPAAPLAVELKTSTGAAGVPRSVTIPAGAKSAAFTITGIRPGVEELLAVPPLDSPYALAAARVQVAAPATVRIAPVAGDRQVPDGVAALPDPVVVRVTDANELPYPGVRIQAAPSAGGTVAPAAAVTDETGQAAFRWTPGPAPANELRLAVEGAPAVSLTVSAGTRVTTAVAVVNAASFAPTIAPGALATVFGRNLAGGGTAQAPLPWPTTLAGVQVTLNGVPAPLTFASDTQVNFLVPRGLREGTAELLITNALGTAAAIRATVDPVAPGIFFEGGTGYGAVLNAGTTDTTRMRPAAPGSYIEIYCTGLGPVRTTGDGLAATTLAPQVWIGGIPATVSYSGLAPGFDGLYQVNARVPDGLSGEQTAWLSVGGVRSNEVKIAVR